MTPTPACACDWPGCSGQCHTGASCPCHPVTLTGAYEDAPLPLLFALGFLGPIAIAVLVWQVLRL